ncbi:hypothetical protein K3M67_19685 (plasmid) [Sphingobium sp. V4]|uniref:hypothetical protein n=1 Tax=Sphingobium sp. V4 TaxID=3038927 RepID=UPI002557D044|nr:hypothetical protein [Sphingobium sp. V4]WIW90268.1 hypothetical protein K3M67_19685 [Sphingobium sp. V4]
MRKLFSPSLAILAALSAQTAFAQDMDGRARSAAAASRAKSGDSDAISRNYLTPGLANQPVSTIDNSRSFTPNIACQQSATMLEILVQPGSTGDITHLSISRDKDLDGSFDSSLTLPVPVSGICANGIISCSPGSWNQCRSFRWDVGSTGDLKLSAVDLPELSGCYCVNASCGTNLVSGNLPSVLKDLGGGVIGALTTADPRIAVAQASIDGPVIRYVGAQTTACSSSPTVSATSYRANPTAISGDAYAASQTNSVFTALAASPAGNGKAEETRSCTIEREISVKAWEFTDIVSASGSISSTSSCGTGCLRFQIGGTGTCGSNPPLYSVTFNPLLPSRIVSARIIEMGADDWVQGRINGQVVGSAGKRLWTGDGLPSGDCRISDDPWYNRTPIDFTDTLKSGATSVSARVRGGGGGNWGTITVEIQVDTSCEVSERLVDLCTGYASDPTCRLTQDVVDGVETVRNGVVTGLKPLPLTRLFGTGNCTFQYSRDFFLRTRRYACVVDTSGTVQPDLARATYIIDHSTETLLADQTRASEGSLVQSTRAFALPDRPAVAACETICKTRAPSANSGVAPSGAVAEKQNVPVGWDSFYHVCSADNVCPLGEGEEIVSPCGCLDDFPEAVVMMQTVRLAGSDLACTAVAR